MVRLAPLISLEQFTNPVRSDTVDAPLQQPQPGGQELGFRVSKSKETAGLACNNLNLVNTQFHWCRI